MLKKEFLVIDEMGLHARPASLVVGMANKYKSNIDIEFKDKKLSLKSIMMVMSLGIRHEETFTIHFDGEDEEEALNALSEFLLEQKVCK